MSNDVADTSPEEKPCIECAKLIPRRATLCTFCKSAQVGTPCKTCQERIRYGSKRCNVCESYQDWRRHFSVSQAALALLIALFAVIANLFTAGSYLAGRESNTTFKVSSNDSKFLYLKVWNTGQKPSTLTGFRLKFSDHLPIENATLDLAADDAVIVPGNPIKIAVTVKELALTLLKVGGKERHGKPEVKALIDKQDQGPIMLTLEVDVEESGHLWNPTSRPFVATRKDTFSADRISKFILGRIPDYDAK